MGEIVNFFWVGKKLGPIHTACIRSFQRHGHPARLHCFDLPEDAPEGTMVFDASQLMRRDEINAYRQEKSLALSSNIYRYRLLAAGFGLYADCDVLCLRAFPERDWLFGWESDRSINSAVLKAPADSDLVRLLIKATADGRFIAPWWPKRKQRLHVALGKIGMGYDLSRTKWGSTGPKLLTHAVKELGLTDHALPEDAFYPLHPQMTNLLLQSGLSLRDLFTPRSYAIHLCYHSIGHHTSPPEGSPLAELLAGE
jgi:hypothetical protein